MKLAPFASERASGRKGRSAAAPFTLRETRISSSAAREPLQVGIVACICNVEVIGRIGGTESDTGHSADQDEIDAVADQSAQQGMGM